MKRKKGMLLFSAAFLVLSSMALFAVAEEDHHAAEHQHGQVKSDQDCKEHQAGMDHKCGKHDHATAAAAGNPLIEEMQILDGAYREVVSAVSVGDGKRVYEALHSMHGTMEKTHEGVHHGTVKLKKNAAKLETFVKMDKEFHNELEKLADAAQKNDQQRMLLITKGLLDGCVKCHQMFR